MGGTVDFFYQHRIQVDMRGHRGDKKMVFPLSHRKEEIQFSGNTAEFASAVIVYGPGSAASCDSNTYFFQIRPMVKVEHSLLEMVVRFHGVGKHHSLTTLPIWGSHNISSESEVQYTGDTCFINNSSSSDGSAITIYGSRISWSGKATFRKNVADKGSALAVRYAGEARWEGNTLFSERLHTPRVAQSRHVATLSCRGLDRQFFQATWQITLVVVPWSVSVDMPRGKEI